MTTTDPGHEVARPAGADGPLVPMTLELASIRRLLVADVADDPTYRAMEPQLLDGPDGTGLVLLAYRHDGQVEIYAEPHAGVTPSGYEGLGKGLLAIHRTPFRSARFEVMDDGLKLDIAFTAANGRSVELRLHEHLTGPRDRFPVLAPVGGAFDSPAFFPFVWLPGLSFLPARGTEVALRVDGEERTIARLPLPVGGRRCLMARYDPEAMVCQLNPDWVTELQRAPVPTEAPGHERGVEVADVDGHPGIGAVWVRRDGHTCGVMLDPPLPDLTFLAPSAHHRGLLTLQADGLAELVGHYELRRDGDRVHLVIDRLGPWRTRQRRPLLGVLFSLPVFRGWPTTYRWQGELAGVDPAGPAARWSSSWSRSAGS